MANVLTNEGSEDQWLVKAPAFSITKVQTTFGTLLAAVLGAVPASLTEERSVVIAGLAAGTFILLGIFALVAVDIKTRQRAEEAETRYGATASGTIMELVAVPAERLRMMRAGSDDEYEVDLVKVTGDSVRLVATRAGESISVSFNIPSTEA